MFSMVPDRDVPSTVPKMLAVYRSVLVGVTLNKLCAAVDWTPTGGVLESVKVVCEVSNLPSAERLLGALVAVCTPNATVCVLDPENIKSHLKVTFATT